MLSANWECQSRFISCSLKNGIILILLRQLNTSTLSFLWPSYPDMHVETILSSASPTKNKSGFCCSSLAISIFGLFDGTDRSHSYPRSMTCVSSDSFNVLTKIEAHLTSWCNFNYQILYKILWYINFTRMPLLKNTLLGYPKDYNYKSGFTLFH